jgi:hypothetical protein
MKWTGIKHEEQSYIYLQDKKLQLQRQAQAKQQDQWTNKINKLVASMILVEPAIEVHYLNIKHNK